MRYRKWVAAAALGLALAPGVGHAADFRVLSSWDQGYLVRPRFLDVYLRSVESASKGDMRFIVNGPETVPPFEQLQPTSRGAFQMLLTHGAYHVGQTPYLTSVEGVGGDLKGWRDAGIREKIDAHYQQLGLKLVVLGQTPPRTALHIMLRQPIGPSGDLQGRKIRGTVTYNGVFQYLGATPVVLPGGEIYTALEKGVVDGAGWPVIGMFDYRWYEVAKYVTRPQFGMLTYPIFFNLNAWNRLTSEQKEIMLQEGRKAEDAFYVEWVKLASEEAAKLAERGVQVSEIKPDKHEGLHKAMADTLFEMGLQTKPKEVGELRDFARSKGLY
jgi:TRAP-type mannitol/chloroaromatic compound transport system substrate-binding protein